MVDLVVGVDPVLFLNADSGLVGGMSVSASSMYEFVLFEASCVQLSVLSGSKGIGSGMNSRRGGTEK